MTRVFWYIVHMYKNTENSHVVSDIYSEWSKVSDIHCFTFSGDHCQAHWYFRDLGIMGARGFFPYNAQPPYKIRHQIKFWVPQLLGHKIGLLRCPRPILGWMSPI